MVLSLLIELLVILILILANGFFAASEIAVVSARKGRLEQQAQAGNRGAATALELAENPNRFLSTVQIGITLISTLAAAFGGARIAELLTTALEAAPALAPYAESLALAIVVLGISYLSLILGELVPKRLALQNAEGVAMAMARVMSGLAWFTAPVVSFLTFSTELVLRLLGRHKTAEAPITEDDIMALVREGAAGGTVEEAEEDLIGSVFAFTERTVRSVMTPRTQMVAIEIHTPVADVLRMVVDSGYSRIPIYETTLEQIVGVLYIKDLLRVWGQDAAVDLRTLIRPPVYVLEGQRAVSAFQQLKQHHSGLAIVLDEYGQVAGLITMEDMLEELVGELADEYDEREDSITRREDGSYLIDGLLPAADLAERLHLPAVQELARERGFETAAGLVITLLGRIPAVGDRLEWQAGTFEVVDMDGHRIDKLLFQPAPVANEQTERVLASGALLPPPHDTHQ